METSKQTENVQQYVKLLKDRAELQKTLERTKDSLTRTERGIEGFVKDFGVGKNITQRLHNLGDGWTALVVWGGEDKAPPVTLTVFDASGTVVYL